MNSIKATTTEAGLTIYAELDSGTYGAGVKFTDTGIDALPIHRHRFHATGTTRSICNTADTVKVLRSAARGLPPQFRVGGQRNPELSGVTEPALDELVEQFLF